MASPNPYSVLQTVENITQQFEQADLVYAHGTDNAVDEAVYLVFTVCKIEFDCTEESLHTVVTQQQQERIQHLAERRITQRMPMAYLLQQAWFCGLPFYVDESVLIPRSPIAELIQQQFQPWIALEQVKTVLDIGTGSGCIAIACAYAFPDAQIDAVDIQTAALDVANKNIQEHHCTERVHALHSDLFAALDGKRYDLIVSNPPYVSDDEVESLAKEFHFEPVSGLRADEQGLALVKKILRQASAYLNEKGILVVEVGYSQQYLIEALPEVPFFWFEFEHGGEGVFMLQQEQLLALRV